jgi:hypothetical protein
MIGTISCQRTLVLNSPILCLKRMFHYAELAGFTGDTESGVLFEWIA